VAEKILPIGAGLHLAEREFFIQGQVLAGLHRRMALSVVYAAEDADTAMLWPTAPASVLTVLQAGMNWQRFEALEHGR